MTVKNSVLTDIKTHKEITVPLILITLFLIFIFNFGIDELTELTNLQIIVSDIVTIQNDLINAFGALAIFLYGFVPSVFRIIGTTGFFIALITEGINPFILIGLGALGETLGSALMYILGRYIFRLFKGKHRELASAEHFLVKYRILIFFLVPYFGSGGDILMILAGHQRIGLLRILPLVFVGNFIRYGIWLFMTIGQINL